MYQDVVLYQRCGNAFAEEEYRIFRGTDSKNQNGNAEQSSLSWEISLVDDDTETG